jgi:hypothetical protein
VVGVEGRVLLFHRAAPVRICQNRADGRGYRSDPQLAGGSGEGLRARRLPRHHRVNVTRVSVKKRMIHRRVGARPRRGRRRTHWWRRRRRWSRLPPPLVDDVETPWRRWWRTRLLAALVDEAEAPGRWGRGARSHDRNVSVGYNGRQRRHREQWWKFRCGLGRSRYGRKVLVRGRQGRGGTTRRSRRSSTCRVEEEGWRNHRVSGKKRKPPQGQQEVWR